ncbi:MAG TPA: hypothetical protein VIZ31_01755 [Vicinamibacteria bacterium]
MSERLLSGETPVEFFRHQLVRAMEHQRVSTSAFTEYYLVNLLAACLRGDRLPSPEPGFDEVPLALLYARALSSSRHERSRLLRAMGDTALFVSGFFAQSLDEGAGSLRYYCDLGGHAYARLAHEHETGKSVGPAVFGELAGHFREFVDVLNEVSETTRLNTPLSVVRLYERWLQTGSRRAALLLSERGITPHPAVEGTRH